MPSCLAEGCPRCLGPQHRVRNGMSPREIPFPANAQAGGHLDSPAASAPTSEENEVNCAGGRCGQDEPRSLVLESRRDASSFSQPGSHLHVTLREWGSFSARSLRGERKASGFINGAVIRRRQSVDTMLLGGSQPQASGRSSVARRASRAQGRGFRSCPALKLFLKFYFFTFPSFIEI